MPDPKENRKLRVEMLSKRHREGAFQTSGCQRGEMRLKRLRRKPKLAPNDQLPATPGGFSHGDDIPAGRSFANHSRRHRRDSAEEFKPAGKLPIGICNGVQILVKSG